MALHRRTTPNALTYENIMNLNKQYSGKRKLKQPMICYFHFMELAKIKRSFASGVWQTIYSYQMVISTYISTSNPAVYIFLIK